MATTTGTVEAAPELGEIRGYKWHDLDGDGVWDDGEPGLGGWQIYLDSNSNGQHDAGEPITTTDGDGEYEFTGLAAGTYAVAEVQQAGFQILHTEILTESANFNMTIEARKP